MRVFGLVLILAFFLGCKKENPATPPVNVANNAEPYYGVFVSETYTNAAFGNISTGQNASARFYSQALSSDNELCDELVQAILLNDDSLKFGDAASGYTLNTASIAPEMIYGAWSVNSNGFIPTFTFTNSAQPFLLLNGLYWLPDTVSKSAGCSFLIGTMACSSGSIVLDNGVTKMIKTIETSANSSKSANVKYSAPDFSGYSAGSNCTMTIMLENAYISKPKGGLQCKFIRRIKFSKAIIFKP